MVQAVTLIIIAVLTLIDQLTKYLVVNNLEIGESCLTIPHFIEVRYVRNYGGMMGTFEGMGRLLGAVTILILAAGIILIILKKIRLGVPYVCITMIIAGGIGNLIDRMRLGYVIDFINVLFVDFYVFNFADCLVTVGAFLLIFYEIYSMIKDPKKKVESDA